MRKHSVAPERRKGLIASAEKHLGKSPEEAVKFVDKVLADEAVKWAKNPDTMFFVHTFADRTAPRGRGIDDEVSRAIIKEEIAEALHKLEQREATFTLINGIRANLKTWAKYPSWTQLEAVYVMRGLDINKIMSKRILTEANKSNFPTFKQINETNDLAQRCVQSGVIGANAHPVKWLNWAKDYDVPVIEDLPQLVLEHFQKTMTPERKAKFDALVEGKPEEVPTAPNSEIKRLFTVDMDKAIKETFHEQIRSILVKLSEAGERRPSGAEMRDYLRDNPKSAEFFIEVDHYRDIHYRSEKPNKTKDKMTRPALHKLIDRITSVAK